MHENWTELYSADWHKSCDPGKVFDDMSACQIHLSIPLFFNIFLSDFDCRSEAGRGHVPTGCCHSFWLGARLSWSLSHSTARSFGTKSYKASTEIICNRMVSALAVSTSLLDLVWVDIRRAPGFAI